MARRILMLMGLGMALALTGCQKQLFPPNAVRTQYDRYARLRGQTRQETRQDQWGADRPNLRGRLAPLEQPY